MNRGARAAVAVGGMGLVSVTLAASAQAAPEELWQVPPQGQEASGASAGKLNVPAGVGVNPVNGRVYIASIGNARVDELTAWGQFVAAFGWDVAPGAVDETQEVRVRAVEGEFRLGFEAASTGDIPYDASAATVQAELDALTTIGGAGGSVSVSRVAGSATGAVPFVYVVVFKGSLAGSDVPQITAVDGAEPLGGGSPTTVLEAGTRANGTAGGTGLEACTAESGCQAGAQGPGAGQLDGPWGLAVDSSGDFYVFEGENHRVQKYGPAGEFIWMRGRNVNKTKVEELGASQEERDLCRAVSGNECQSGEIGAGNGEFSNPAFGSYVAISPPGSPHAGDLFVGDVGRIEELKPSGEYVGKVEGAALAGKAVSALAMDGAGDFYLAKKLEPNALELGPAGEALRTYVMRGEAAEPEPSALAADAAGDLYAVEDPPSFGQVNTEPRVVEFGPAGEKLIPTPEEEAAEKKNPPVAPFAQGPLGFRFMNGLSAAAPCGVGGEELHVTYESTGSPQGSMTRAYGVAPEECESPPPAAPEIAAQYATAAGPDSATLKAQVDSHFWTDTTYYVQYGTGKCSEGGCTQVTPAPPGALLGSRTDTPATTSGVALGGLSPHTTYHYRFVAETVFGPGEAALVRGVGGEVGVDGEEGTFTTQALSAGPKGDCPNQAYRTGPSAFLSDCRAYEMVSPVEKSGGDVYTLQDNFEDPTALDRASTAGDALAYSTFRAFGDADSAPYTAQYLATRTERGQAGEGWSSRGISPPLGRNVVTGGAHLDVEFRAFSPDLCRGWLFHDTDPPLAAGAIEGYANLYATDLCGAGGYEALLAGREEEPIGKPQSFVPDLQGVSGDGKTAIFSIPERLTANATAGKKELYAARGGQLRLACVLPSGAAYASDCSAGTPASENIGIRRNTVYHAISADGQRVFWSAASLGTGQLYVRENPFAAQSAVEEFEAGKFRCTEPAKACTLAIGSGTGRFWTAAADGSKAIYTVGSKLEEADLGEEAGHPVAKTHLIAEGVLGVAGASEDASRVYFVSEKAIAGTSGATAGKPNLYLYEDREGTPAFAFVATLSAEDALLTTPPSNGRKKIPSALNPQPYKHSAEASPDGLHLVFMSNSTPLAESSAGLDNADAASGNPDAEVYLYDASASGGAGRLVCVSCNPTGARPAGANITANATPSYWVAAQFPRAESQLYAPRVLSADGSRVFFESFEALVPRDTNGRQDVYEWEVAEGEGAAAEAQCAGDGAELYSARAHGCISLISSGEGGGEAELVDSSADGRDVFFTTGASLLASDPGLIDIYDAREGGGFPQPEARPECEGSACQSPASPPQSPSAASAGFAGVGNLREGPQSGGCAKGKAPRKGRCVKTPRKHGHKKQHRRKHRHQRASTEGGTARW